MEEFPKDKIKPIRGKLSGANGDVSLEVELEPFEISIEGYSENVDSSIRLDGINIPLKPAEMEGRAYDFPANPEDGYIDGSIYLYAAHNPVDVTQIKFGSIKENKLPVKLITNWVLEFENTGFKNFETEIETNIEL